MSQDYRHKVLEESLLAQVERCAEYLSNGDQRASNTVTTLDAMIEHYGDQQYKTKKERLAEQLEKKLTFIIENPSNITDMDVKKNTALMEYAGALFQCDMSLMHRAQLFPTIKQVVSESEGLELQEGE